MSSNSSSASPNPSWLQAARDQWVNRGQSRPPFAIQPGPDQESVWDYPRPPAVVPDTRLVVVRSGDAEVARADQTVRVLETASPPAFYLPPASIAPGALVPIDRTSHCEWKGQAEYLALRPGGDPVGWRYPNPYALFAEHAGWVSFYPDRVACEVAGETVRAQESTFYGGWITDDVVGPFKGAAGTSGW